VLELLARARAVITWFHSLLFTEGGVFCQSERGWVAASREKNTCRAIGGINGQLIERGCNIDQFPIIVNDKYMWPVRIVRTGKGDGVCRCLFRAI